MCGIFALFDPNLSPEDLERLCRERTALLAHRGPDDVGCQVGAGFALGHARLSIVDPSGGHQPLVDSQTGNALVVNGEIYNHLSLRDLARKDRAARGASAPAYATHSDSESILPLYADRGVEVASLLDGMFAFCVATPDGAGILAGRDPCGIKPLYRGWSRDGRVLFASELKCIVGVCDEAEEFPAGHYWTPATGYVRYFRPAWLEAHLNPAVPLALPKGGMGRVRGLLRAAVEKRLMSDVGFGLLLSGGLDSAIVCKLMSELTDMSRIKSFTVGMANSPDIMAARAIAKRFGTQHHEYIFTPDEAFSAVPKVVYHLETYEPELIRSSIPNYFLAKLAGSHTKCVITGEGADELFAGYLYFRECPSPELMHRETLRIWDHLHSVNLQRSDRMGMAHGLEARVPFLDVDMLAEAYGEVDPALKMHDPANGRMEKWALRALFDGEIPHEILWRTKAMQCEGVGMDWVAILQAKCAAEVSDEAFVRAAERFPLNTPQSKEEFYYRELFTRHFEGMDKFVHVWSGGCRAGGAPWQNEHYTRAGLKDPMQLRHGLMEGSGVTTEAGTGRKIVAPDPSDDRSGLTIPAAPVAPGLDIASSDAPLGALAEALVAGGDSRLVLNQGVNKYFCPPKPQERAVVRGSCTSSPPTSEGYRAAAAVHARLEGLGAARMAAAFAAEMDAVREVLAEALALPAGTAIVLAASGTDAEYIPLAIARELFPDSSGVVSVLAAAAEVGSGCSQACAGEYFDPDTPFGSAARSKGAPVEGLEEVELISVPARASDGAVVDVAPVLRKRVFSASRDAVGGNDDRAWVVRRVVGTKTGFSTSVAETDVLPPKSLTVVDACQLRVTREEIQSFLSQESVVLITGSKFMQGAAFSGAALIPESIVARLKAGASTAPPLPPGLGDFFSKYEVPSDLAHWRAQLHDGRNAGLLLRWHTALPLMKRVFDMDVARRADLERRWTQYVCSAVRSSPNLDVLCTDMGIVSIKCARAGAKDSFYGHAELQMVHKWMAVDMSAHGGRRGQGVRAAGEDAPVTFPTPRPALSGAYHCAAAGTVVFIGQPVKITKVRQRLPAAPPLARPGPAPALARARRSEASAPFPTPGHVRPAPRPRRGAPRPDGGGRVRPRHGRRRRVQALLGGGVL